MLVKDLPSHEEKALKGLKLRTKTGVIGYFFSEFQQGVFFNPVKDETAVRERLYPQLFDKREDILEWEIVDDNVRANCDIFTSLKHTISPIQE